MVKASVTGRQRSNGIDAFVNVNALLNPWSAILIKNGTTARVPVSLQSIALQPL